MVPRHLLALTLALALDPFLKPWTSVSAAQSGSFLTETNVREDPVQNVLEHTPAKEPGCQQFPTGPIETTLCDYETIESVNEVLYETLHELVQTPFFKYFRVDLYRDCPFWQENGFCMNRECGITTVDESEIPERWRAAALSKVEVPKGDQRSTLPGCYYRDSDYCFLDDLSADGDYIDLSLNPERFTGYSGPSAHRVWSSIYQENCFGIAGHNLLSSPDNAPGSLQAAANGAESENSCLEERVYYKIISGLHASISTHICHEDLNQTTGEWAPNLKCFISRVASHPERLQYIYFDTVLLLRAVARIGPYLTAYDYCGTGEHEDDAATLSLLTKVVDIATAAGKFDETVLFRGDDANILKEEFKQHFRNVSRIMDCVGCDKCRLWGKVQTTGLGTALKILFELDEKALNPQTNANLLQRSEVVALINTLHRLAESLAAVNNFRKMWAEVDPAEEARLIEEAGSAAPSASKPRRSPAAGTDGSAQTFLEDLVGRIACLLRACKDGTVGCVHELVDGARSILQAVAQVFRTSGKERGPHSEF